MFKIHFKEKPWFYYLLAFAALIKFSLFIYTFKVIPEAFIDPDSLGYLRDSNSFRAFFLNPAGGLTHGMFALPGYPLILAFWRHALGLTLFHVIFFQIFMNFLTAVVVARIAYTLNPKWEMFSFLIVIFDVPLTIYSQLVMTEAFFVFFLVCFIFLFHRYLARPGFKRLISAALVLVGCCYIRPAAMYLPFVVTLFIIWFRCPGGNLKKSLAHAVVILILFYGLTVPWQYRNYKRFGDARMSSIGDNTIKRHSFFKDTREKKAEVAPTMPDVLFYPYAFNRNIMELMTTPGSTKHVGSKPILYFTKGFGYFFVAFWIPGFVAGLALGVRDKRYSFLIWVFLYFLVATIGATGWTVTSRFRIAMLPSIAVIAAAGWYKIYGWWKKNFRNRPDTE